MASKFGIKFTYKDRPGYENIWYANQTQRDQVYKSWTPAKLRTSNVKSITEIQS